MSKPVPFPPDKVSLKRRRPRGQSASLVVVDDLGGPPVPLTPSHLRACYREWLARRDLREILEGRS